MPSLVQASLRSSYIDDHDNDQSCSASSSNNFCLSVPSLRQPVSRRHETLKVKRKALSNRTVPYDPHPVSHSVGSIASTIEFDDETENSNRNMSQK